MLNEDGLCLLWACVPSLHLSEAGPGLPILSQCLLSRQSGGDFCLAAPSQPAEPAHKVQLCLSQEKTWQKRGLSPPLGQRCLVGSRGDLKGCWPTQPCLLHRT